jgi:hypothetical protein
VAADPPSPTTAPDVRTSLTWIVPASLAIVLGAVYGATLLPGAGHSGDTAEMQFSGRLLCVTHPTGYPTYLLLSHAFSWLVPFGSLAFRANLLSAVFGVATCLVIYRLLLRLGARRWAAAAAALALGLTPTFWRFSVVAEVYTLHTLFVALVADGFVRWRQSGRRRHLIVACGLYALSFGNHLMMVTLLPAVVFVVVATRWRVLTEWSSVAAVASLIGLGALQYAYPVWRSLDPATPYLSVSVTNLPDLWAYATGAWFRGAMFAFSPGELLGERVPLFARHWIQDCGPMLPFFVLGLAGFRDRIVFAFFALVFLGHLAFALNYDIGDIDAYFIPSVLVTAIVAGLGLEWLLSRAPVLPAALCLVLPVSLCGLHWTRVEEARGADKAEPMRELLDEVRDGAFIVARYNEYLYLLYFALAEGRAGPAVFIGFEIPVEDLTAYVEHDRPVYLRQLRRWVPPGLPVYSMKLSQRPALRAAGLQVRLSGRGMYRIEAPREPPDRAPAEP